MEAERSGDQYDAADKSITLDGRTESPADAARKAKAKLQDKNGKENTCTIDMMGCPSLYAGLVISLTGYGTFSGNYLVKKATHKFSSSGYTTSAELSKCRSKEDKVLVAKSVEVTSRASVEKKQEENQFKNTAIEIAGWAKKFELAVELLSRERRDDFSKEDWTILCLPDIAEVMAERQSSEKDRQGWLLLQSMFERWIGEGTRIGPSGSTPLWVDWGWLMQFERARVGYHNMTVNNGPKFSSPNDVTNAAAFVSLGKILKKHG